MLAYNSHEILQFSDYVAEFKHRLVPMRPFGWSINQPLSLVITATVCVWNSSCISLERDCFAVVTVSKFGFGMFLEV
jgi:hypothetical protein